MHYRLAPPTRGFQQFDLFRDAFEDQVTLRLFGSSTYILAQEELAVWLQKAGCDKAGKVVDLCWNFRHVHYDLAEQRHVLPKDEDYEGNPPLYQRLDGLDAGGEGLIIEAALGIPIPFNVQHYEGLFDGPQSPGGL